MKFKAALFVLFAMVALCTACSSRPDDLSDKMYECAESVIKAVDAYMDNDSTFEEAYRKIEGISGQAKEVSDDTVENLETTDMKTRIAIYSIKHEISEEHSGASTYADLLRERNILAEKIGYPTRD